MGDILSAASTFGNTLVGMTARVCTASSTQVCMTQLALKGSDVVLQDQPGASSWQCAVPEWLRLRPCQHRLLPVCSGFLLCPIWPGEPLLSVPI